MNTPDRDSLRKVLATALLVAAVVLQVVLPWAHVELDHAVGHANAAAVGQVLTSHDSHGDGTHAAADCPVCHWVRSNLLGSVGPAAAGVFNASQKLHLFISLEVTPADVLSFASPRAPPVAG